MSSNSNSLVDEKLAVSLFLDSLLRDTDDFTESAEPEVQVVAEIAAPIELEAPQIVPSPVETKVEVKSEIQEESTESKSSIPEWANEPFQILLFEVAGLKLAVPLIELSGVIEWKDSVTEMPGSADFYMGILQHLEYRIAVIDTA